MTPRPGTPCSTPGTPLRAMGDQEYDITKSVQYMTKFAAMLEDPKDIRYLLEKAWHLATTGRPGPVWLDIPVNFQGGYIETDELRGYDPAEDDAQLPPPVDDATIRTILEKIKNAKRPVFHAGYGIRLSGGYAAFRSVAEKLNIPIVTYWNAVDLIEDDNPLYCGRAGNMGDRPGQLGYSKRRLDSGRRHAHFYPPGRLQLEDLGPRGRGYHGGH